MKLKIKFLSLFTILPSVLSSIFSPVSSQTVDKDEDDIIVITVEFLPTTEQDLAASVSLIDKDQITNRSAQHLEDLLNMAPNVNFASGASRGRFIQIRGIGERGEFVEPVNYSVGVLLDGIDLTGISTAATMLDIQQVEVLRGPQGTLYGANALAGLINIVSNPPSSETEGSVEATIGNYNTRVLGAVLSGPLSNSVGYRIAAQKTTSDGFIDNKFLNRDDTNNIDETALRAKLTWQASDILDFDLTTFYADIDNGYDAFSLDNTRNTLSDEPGHDRQVTQAASLKTTWSGSNLFDVVALFSTTASDIEYGFDEDWSNPFICAGLSCQGLEFSSFDNYLRDNRNHAIDLRLVSQPSEFDINWTAGAYLRDQNKDLNRVYTFSGTDFGSQYETRNIALYSEINVPLTEKITLVSGLRFEQQSSDYIDNNGQNLDSDENFWGGKLSLEYKTDDGPMVYGLLSRGYKAGGFNANASIPSELREYEGETMLNVEFGLKGHWLDDRLQGQLSVFFQDRKDIQTDQSFVEPVTGNNCPCTFEDYIDNAASGENYGLEAEVSFNLNAKIKLFGSLGLLETRFNDFISFSHVDADPNTGTGVDLDGREQAHAPNWQYTLGVDYFLGNHWSLRVDTEGKDAFFFGDGHNEKSNSYNLMNARLSWESVEWLFAIWGKNLTDEDYYTRGFGSFGNDPRKFYETEPYYQFGAPRTVGLTVSYRY